MKIVSYNIYALSLRTKNTASERHIIHTISTNMTVYISLHPTRALGYTAVTGSTKEFSIRTETYNDDVSNKNWFCRWLKYSLFFALYEYMYITHRYLSAHKKDRQNKPRWEAVSWLPWLLTPLQDKHTTAREQPCSTFHANANRWEQGLRMDNNLALVFIIAWL